MTPEDAYKRRVVIGDRVRHIQTGREFRVLDLVPASVKGDKMKVIVDMDLFFDITELEKI